MNEELNQRREAELGPAIEALKAIGDIDLPKSLLTAIRINAGDKGHSEEERQKLLDFADSTQMRCVAILMVLIGAVEIAYFDGDLQFRSLDPRAIEQMARFGLAEPRGDNVDDKRK